MESHIVVAVSPCAERAADLEWVCLADEDALHLRAFSHARVLVEIEWRGHTLQFDLEDVCLHGQRSASGQCWCLPIAKAIGMA
jgi:hypothetical protein